ncbi:hypothetical protein [Paenibacillus sp. FSL K6-0108]|uniref:hypothetical protein n=1 Tax=Paenibacillus sp. FSL K6-0108 TaxID=2921417 RepID=UPI003250965A
MAITFKGRIAECFGHTKNARITINLGQPEPQTGHVNWAIHQDVSAVQNEIQNDSSQVSAKIPDVSKDVLDNVFGFLKDARLVLTSGKIEKYDDHVAWAKQNDRQTVINEINHEISTIQNNNQYSTLDLFPIVASEHTGLGQHRNMETKITISKNGRIDGDTHTDTGDHYQGFHGYVAVFLCDVMGNILWSTQEEHKFGVDGVYSGKPSRNDNWTENIPNEVLGDIEKCVIIHSTTKVSSLTPEEVGKWIKAFEPVIKAFA